MKKIADNKIDELLSRKTKEFKKEDSEAISAALDELRQRRMYEKIAMGAYEATGRGVLFKRRCATTAFDMTVKVIGDGRERGIWIELTDKERTGYRLNHFNEAVESWLVELEIPEKKRFSAMMWAKDLYRDLAGTEVRESALLEWPNAKRFHQAIGKEIERAAKAEKED